MYDGVPETGFSVIPGRRKAAGPESTAKCRMIIWIPGSSRLRPAGYG